MHFQGSLARHVSILGLAEGSLGSVAGTEMLILVLTCSRVLPSPLNHENENSILLPVPMHWKQWHGNCLVKGMFFNFNFSVGGVQDLHSTEVIIRR